MITNIFASKNKLLWIGTFCVSAVLYLLTAQQGVCWQDSATHQWRVITGDYTGNFGIASAHPLYIAMGQLFLLVPEYDLATRVTLASGVGMAVALANLVLLVFQLTGRRWIGIATALMLSVMHTVWWLSTIAETYTWNAAFMTGELLLLVHLIRTPKWQTVVALAFLNGLNLSLHNLALLALPVYVVVLIVLVKKRRLPAWVLAASATAFIVGSVMYVAMIINFALEKGGVRGALNSALFGKFSSEVLNIQQKGHYLKINTALGSLNFFNFSLPLAVIGWFRMRSCLGGFLAAALMAITVIHFGFVIRYPVPDQFMFLLPSLIMIMIAASVGVSVLAERSGKWRIGVIFACAVSVIMPPIIYAMTPKIIELAGIKVERERQRPFRNEIRYWAIPWKHNERSAEQFAEAALKQALPNGIIISDLNAYYPLVLVQQRDSASASEVSVKLSGINEKPNFQNILLNRPVFLVLPELKLLAPDIMTRVNISRKKEEVLYSVKWTNH
jgi:hypothetical protein